MDSLQSISNSTLYAASNCCSKATLTLECFETTESEVTSQSSNDYFEMEMWVDLN